VHASLSSSSGIPLETLHRTFCTLTLHSFYHYSCRSVFYPSSSTPSEYQSITRVACTCGNIPYSSLDVQVHVHVGIKFDSYPKMYRW
jgi:hypothetical protein